MKYSQVTHAVKMSSVSHIAARLAVWRIDRRSNSYPIIIDDTFGDVIGRAITDDYGDVYAAPFPPALNWKSAELGM